MDIFAIVAILGLVALLIVKEILSYKKFIATEKLKKTKTLSETEYVFGSDKKEDVGEDITEDNLVPLEAIPDGVIPKAPEISESEGK